MSKRLIVREEIFEYPDTGDINYGEEATGWAEEITDVATEISGPGDIPTTEIVLSGTISGDFVTGNVTGLNFDTAFVQRIEVEGFITRTYLDATPTKVESFVIQGAYNSSIFNITTEYSGEDTEIEFDTTGGQITFSYFKPSGDQTNQVIVKYRAKAIIDESFFE